MRHSSRWWSSESNLSILIWLLWQVKMTRLCLRFDFPFQNQISTRFSLYDKSVKLSAEQLRDAKNSIIIFCRNKYRTRDAFTASLCRDYKLKKRVSYSIHWVYFTLSTKATNSILLFFFSLLVCHWFQRKNKIRCAVLSEMISLVSSNTKPCSKLCKIRVLL